MGGEEEGKSHREHEKEKKGSSLGPHSIGFSKGWTKRIFLDEEAHKTRKMKG
jgi:hypothetical protein